MDAIEITVEPSTWFLLNAPKSISHSSPLTNPIRFRREQKYQITWNECQHAIDCCLGNGRHCRLNCIFFEFENHKWFYNLFLFYFLFFLWQTMPILNFEWNFLFAHFHYHFQGKQRGCFLACAESIRMLTKISANYGLALNGFDCDRMIPDAEMARTCPRFVCLAWWRFRSKWISRQNIEWFSRIPQCAMCFNWNSFSSSRWYIIFGLSSSPLCWRH